MGVKFKGFDDFSKKLKKLEQGVAVGFGELFNDAFMARYTNFNNIDEFFEKSPFDVEAEEDFDNIDTQELDKYVRDHTKFTDWEDMKGTAGKQWTAKQLGF